MSWITIYVDQPGWSANASSLDVMEGDGRYEFQPGPAAGIIIGLAPNQTYGNMSAYTHAALITKDYIKILVAPITTDVTVLYSFARPINSTVRIQRSSGQVTWWVNGRLIFVSNKPSSGPVILDAQLYAINDQIRSLIYTDIDETINGDGSFSWRSQGSFTDWNADANWNLTSTGTLIDYLGATAYWGYRSRVAWNEIWADGAWNLTSSGELLDRWSATGNWGFKSNGAWAWFAAGNWGYQSSGSFIPKIDIMVANGYWRMYSTGVIEDFTIITGDKSWGLQSFASDVSMAGRGSLSWTSSCTVQSKVSAVFAFYLPSLIGVGYPRLGSVSRTFGYTLRLTKSQRFGYGSNKIYGLHEIIYGQAVNNLHAASWSSSLVNTVQNLHEIAWGSSVSSTVNNLHEITWESTGTVSATNLHEVVWASTSNVTIIALHHTSWESSNPLNTIIGIHENSWKSSNPLNTIIGIHENSWESQTSVKIFNLHESSWTVSLTALGLQQVNYRSVVETLNLHQIRYESISDTTLSLHECRYRSNQVTPVILTGLIYARI